VTFNGDGIVAHCQRLFLIETTHRLDLLHVDFKQAGCSEPLSKTPICLGKG
jgi:hypothetical protein